MASASESYQVLYSSLEAVDDLYLLVENLNINAFAQLERLFTPILENNPYAVVPGLCGPVGLGDLYAGGKGPIRYIRLEDNPDGVAVWYWIDEENHRVMIERIR